MGIKNIALFLFLALPMGAHAETLSIADANQAVIDSCGASGGKMTEFKAGKCDFQRCIYSDNKSDGTFYRAGDNQRSNCTDSELQKELQKIKDDLGINLENNGGSGRGSRDGRDGDDNGGDGRGGRDGRGGGNGRVTSSGPQAGDVISCDWIEGDGRLYRNDKCWDPCTTKKRGQWVLTLDKKRCIRCLSGERNADGSPRYRFRADAVAGLDLPGISTRTGQVQCKNERTGEVVTIVGTECRPGYKIVIGNDGGAVVVNAGSGGRTGSGGTIVVTGSAGTSSGSLPAFCNSDKRSDKKLCEKYLASDRFRCAAGSDLSGCVRDVDVIRSRYSSDCVDCDTRRRGGGSSFAEILGAALPPLAMLGGAYFNSRAQIKSNEAWAGAAAVGFEQCQLHHNNYLQYISANELPGLTPEQQRMMGCNGFGLGQFAGMGGAFGNYYGAGYSPGFMGGMMGPYGMYNPYGGMGGMVGGAVGGYVGGMQGGMPGGMYGGYMGGYSGGAGMIGGGLIGGGAIGGLVQGGYAISGMNGGYMAGGMTAGYPAGGYMAGGMAAGYPAGGYMAGGMAAGYPAGGGIGGLVQGGYAIAGMNGGMAAGYPAGGYGIGGMAAGYPAGGMYAAGGVYPAGGYAGGMGYPAGGGIGGLAQGGYAIAGMGGGMGYPGGMGGYPGMGGGLGGWGSGVGGGGYNPYGYGNGYGGVGGMYGMQASMQASSRDAMLQQQGISYQMGMLGSGSMGAGGMTQPFGYAGYSPMNVGYGLGGYGGYQMGM